MHYKIEVTAPEPVYRQLERQIKERIAKGLSPPHTQLPVVREMAMRLVINPNTVQRVYNDLVREGVLYTRRGVGVFVADIAPTASPEELNRRAVVAVDAMITECVHLNMNREQIRNLVDERLNHFNQGGVEDE